MNKALQIVVTFPTTAQALAFQSKAKACAGLEDARSSEYVEGTPTGKMGASLLLCGRLAPIPRQLSAGCGFAWLEPIEPYIAHFCFNNTNTESVCAHIIEQFRCFIAEYSIEIEDIVAL